MATATASSRVLCYMWLVAQHSGIPEQRSEVWPCLSVRVPCDPKASNRQYAQTLRVRSHAPESKCLYDGLSIDIWYGHIPWAPYFAASATNAAPTARFSPYSIPSRCPDDPLLQTLKAEQPKWHAELQRRQCQEVHGGNLLGEHRKQSRAQKRYERGHRAVDRATRRSLCKIVVMPGQP